MLEGDNLHSLCLLEKTHKNSIDIIYIDPPYNTGRNDFVYNDRFVGDDDEYRHSKWLSKAHEYCLVYTKSKDEFSINKLPILDGSTTRSAYTNPDNDPRSDYRKLGCWARGAQGGVKYDFTMKDGYYFSERLWLMSKYGRDLTTKIIEVEPYPWLDFLEKSSKKIAPILCK